jgi:hypothetical protein
MLNRRQFVSSLVSFGVLGSTSWRANGAPTPGNPKRVSLDGPLCKAVFLAFLGEAFTVSSGNFAVSATLIQIDDGHPSAVTDQFSLVFKGPRDLAVPDGVYTVRHHSAGSAQLFLQTSNSDDYNSFCEARFNLLLKS